MAFMFGSDSDKVYAYDNKGISQSLQGISEKDLMLMDASLYCKDLYGEMRLCMDIQENNRVHETEERILRSAMKGVLREYVKAPVNSVFYSSPFVVNTLLTGESHIRKIYTGYSRYKMISRFDFDTQSPMHLQELSRPVELCFWKFFDINCSLPCTLFSVSDAVSHMQDGGCLKVRFGMVSEYEAGGEAVMPEKDITVHTLITRRGITDLHSLYAMCRKLGTAEVCILDKTELMGIEECFREMGKEGNGYFPVFRFFTGITKEIRSSLMQIMEKASDIKRHEVHMTEKVLVCRDSSLEMNGIYRTECAELCIVTAGGIEIGIRADGM